MPSTLELLDIIFKGLGILLSSIAIFQLWEVRRKRHIDMYWKIYEMYTSDNQKNARKNTVHMRSIIDNKKKSGTNRDDLLKFYSKEYHKTEDDIKKPIDRSIIDRIRFINMIGNLLKENLINKRMLFELIGITFEHDYSTLQIIVETHRRDHNAPKMYSAFEDVMRLYRKWKSKNNIPDSDF